MSETELERRMREATGGAIARALGTLPEDQRNYPVQYQERADRWWTVSVRFEMPPEARTDQMDAILSRVLPRLLRHFAVKHAEYGPQLDDDLGAPGHFADISRKMKKLRRYLWDGVKVPPGAESVQQIMEEMVGHLLFALFWRQYGSPPPETVLDRHPDWGDDRDPRMD